MPPADPTSDRLGEALRLLVAEARERLAQAGVRRAAGDDFELSVRLPLRDGDDAFSAAYAALAGSLDEEVKALAAGQALARPGRVVCLRCGGSACEHAAPPEPRQVLAGYGPTGLPRFLDLAQLLLERGDDRAEHLFAKRAGVIAVTTGPEDLLRDVLPAYRDHLGGLRLHGQVAAGWFADPTSGAGREVLAASWQVLSVGRRGRVRLALHPIGPAADDGVLEAFHHRHDRVPWRSAVSWAETTLAGIEAEARRGRGLPWPQLDGRVAGLLRHLGETLERPSRTRRRQTAHADARHRGGRRPTGAALADVFSAPIEKVFRDPRHQTFVVLGPKGRTHVFSSEGRLVTSVRYGKESIDKKQKMGEWRPAAPEEARGLVAAVRQAVERAGGA